jgi:acetolactate synthase-1/2/3 large subunit
MMRQESHAHWVDFARTLEELGVRHVFGIPGDDLQAYRCFEDSPVEFHLVGDQRHGAYQALASVASGVQEVGVLVLGKGPAVTHALTGILEAREQRMPLLVVTSGVGTSRLGSGAFQELDSVLTLSSFAGRSGTVESPTHME